MENMDLKRRVGLTETKLSSIERLIQDLKKRIQMVGAKFVSMEKTIGQIREAVSSLKK